MRSSHGLRDHSVDQSKLLKVIGREFQGFSGLRGVFAVFPEDCRTAFGGNDRVIGVLHHEDPVSHTDAECSSASPLADDDRDDTGAQGHHLPEVHGDGLCNVTFLGPDAGVGARCVDEADDRKGEFLRHAHEAEGLAVPLGVGAAEIPEDILLHVTALLLADDHAPMASDGSETRWHRLVVTEEPVAVQFHEVPHDGGDIIKEVRACRMARDLNPLPGTEIAVEGPSLFFQVFPRRLEQGVLGAALFGQFGNALLQFGYGKFKVKGLDAHGMLEKGLERGFNGS